MKQLLYLLLAVFAMTSGLPDLAHAQNAIVVATCGTVPIGVTYAPGQTRPVLMDTSGTICTNDAGSGGSVPTGPAGSPNPAAVSVQGVSGGTPQNVAVQSSALPTGASTSALQTAGNSSLTTISGQIPSSLGAKAGAASLSVVSNTDTAFPVSIYNSTLSTQTTGVPLPAQLDQYGNLRATVAGVFSAAADAANKNFIKPVAQNSQGASVGPLWVAQSLSNGTTIDLARTLQATDMASGIGVQAVGIVPTSSASQALTYASTAGSATNVLKASAGNIYGFNLVNSTTAVFAIVYDAATAPTSGTALTTANIKYCFPVAASAGLDKVFNPPVRVTTGATLLASTSCTTYTTPATLPVVLIGEVM